MINIISCFWNAENFIEKCIASVKEQSSTDFRMYLIDDVSTDNTVEVVKKAIGDDARFILVENKEKKWKLMNMVEVLNDNGLVSDEDIIVELDGDDWLHNKGVLAFIEKKYQDNPLLWLTNGSFVYSDGRMGFSSLVNPKTIRQNPFTFSHLRTWKTHLWRKIKPETFKNSSGQPFISAPDLAYSFAMAELSANGHYEFIPEVLYVYNDQSPFNEFKSNSSGGGRYNQIVCEIEIRSQIPYEPA